MITLSCEFYFTAFLNWTLKFDWINQYVLKLLVTFSGFYSGLLLCFSLSKKNNLFAGVLCLLLCLLYTNNLYFSNESKKLMIDQMMQKHFEWLNKNKIKYFAFTSTYIVISISKRDYNKRLSLYVSNHLSNVIKLRWTIDEQYVLIHLIKSFILIKKKLTNSHFYSTLWARGYLYDGLSDTQRQNGALLSIYLHLGKGRKIEFQPVQ